MKIKVLISFLIISLLFLFYFSINPVSNEKRLKVLSSQTINNKKIQVVKDTKSNNQYFLIEQYGQLSLTKIDQVNKTVVIGGESNDR